MPRLCKLYPDICITTEEKHGITSVSVAEKVPFGTPKIMGVVDQLDWLPEELYCSGFRDVYCFGNDSIEKHETYESFTNTITEAAQTVPFKTPVRTAL